MDGGLPDAAPATAQAHIAGCARCRALAGAMARAELATPTPASLGQSRRWLGWAIPLTTAAVIVIAAILPRKPVTPVTPAPAPVAPVAQPQDSSVTQAQASAPDTQRAQKAPARARMAQPVEPKLMADAPLADKVARDEDLAKREDAKKNAEHKDRALVVRSTDPAVQWRAIDTRVERSIDLGNTWQALTPITKNDETTSEVVAGHSPSATVCWFVGQRGLVWLSADGRSWKRLTFPEMTNLSAVTATDAKTATVTTADGRHFHTTDAGNTWVRRDLQDF